MKRSEPAIAPRKPGSKILSARTVARRLAAVRRSGQRIVFTNGCFDILHLGHVRYLAAARRMGDRLFVGLNSDASVRRLKGPERPLNGQDARAEVLAGLESVDFICIFSEDTPEKLIRKVRPHVLVKGGDWDKSRIVGAPFVESYGGQVRVIRFVEGHSTTGLVKRIRRS
ncbi:MAG: Bifunctional protein HldE [Candidatus Omnitrophica bacterium]|nr:Bifunctional protein HldE [Candidatus Omnitrophota bacterium]